MMIGAMIISFLIGFLAGGTAVLAYCAWAARSMRAISQAWEEGIAGVRNISARPSDGRDSLVDHLRRSGPGQKGMHLPSPEIGNLDT